MASPIGFPGLQPMMTIKIDVGEMSKVGTVFNGTTLLHVEFHSGSMETVPGFEPKISAKVISGSDWLYFDADQGHLRVNVKGMAKTEDGAFIGFIYNGPIEMNDYVKPFFAEGSTLKTIPFGSSAIIHTFEVGDPKYKFLENGSFCSNGRFVVDGDKMMAESRISRVVPSTVME